MPENHEVILTDTLQSLPGKWRDKAAASNSLWPAYHMCADELEQALAASGRKAVHPPAADAVAYVNLEMWQSNKHWPDDCFHEQPFDGCLGRDGTTRMECGIGRVPIQNWHSAGRR